MVPSRFCKSTTLLIEQKAGTLPAWNSIKEFQLQSISIIWVPLLCIVWLKYQPRLACYSWFWIYSLLCLDSISCGLACYSISYHALAVSTEAWHAILYLTTPWQYQQRLGMPGMLFYILSRLGSICLGWACYSISYHALAVSAEAARLGMLFWILSRLGKISEGLVLYLITPWQYSPRLGMLFQVLSRLGSICQELTCYSISYASSPSASPSWILAAS